MAASAQHHEPPQSLAYPSLHLYPLNGTFTSKRIPLVAGRRVRICRQTNDSPPFPSEHNGYFPPGMKVISRQHAEIWAEENKIYIRDIRSANGTYVNGSRLSPENVESAPFELNSHDMLDFGVDIVDVDGMIVIHRKVSARVVCVLSEQDLRTASLVENLHASPHNSDGNTMSPLALALPSRIPARSHIDPHQGQSSHNAPTVRAITSIHLRFMHIRYSHSATG